MRGRPTRYGVGNGRTLDPLRRATSLLPFLAAGCAAGINTSVDEPVRPHEPVAVESLALMPVTMEAGSEGFRPDLMADLVAALRERFPRVPIVDPVGVGQRLSESPAATEYAWLLADYERTGVVESARLGRIAGALGVSHFLQVRGSYLRESFLDPQLFDHSEVAVESRQEIVAVARLWADRGAGPVWEAVARTTSETDDFTTPRRPLELFGDLVLGLVERIPVG